MCKSETSTDIPGVVASSLYIVKGNTVKLVRVEAISLVCTPTPTPVEISSLFSESKPTKYILLEYQAGIAAVNIKREVRQPFATMLRKVFRLHKQGRQWSGV